MAIEISSWWAESTIRSWLAATSEAANCRLAVARLMAASELTQALKMDRPNSGTIAATTSMTRRVRSVIQPVIASAFQLA
ncbi:hypothetical protein LP415_24930 [Polaromonas sp. P1(28)-8]|nr:hypothetical protein LP415_24930 [Polaromonas sp. P1(28)-8]